MGHCDTNSARVLEGFSIKPAGVNYKALLSAKWQQTTQDLFLWT